MARKTRTRSSVLANAIDRLAACVREGGRTFSLLAVACCLVAVALLLAIGVPRLRIALDERSWVEASAITVRFTNAPKWFDQIRHDEVRRRVAEAVGDGSALAPARLELARTALLESGWFVSIAQVRLDGGDGGNAGFLVDATFRVPVAVVLHGDREHLVDADGCRLPADWILGQRPSQPHWISLVHASEPPPGLPGTRWSGRDVQAGLELLQATFDKPWEHQIAAIDLAQLDRDGLVLLTTNGGFIVWGYAPSVATSAEPPASAKLHNLDVLFARTGHIDNGGGRIVDLRTDVPSVRLAAATLNGASHNTDASAATP